MRQITAIVMGFLMCSCLCVLGGCQSKSSSKEPWVSYRDQAEAPLKQGDANEARKLLKVSVEEGMKTPSFNSRASTAKELDKLFALYARLWSLDRQQLPSLTKQAQRAKCEEILNEAKTCLNFGEKYLGSDAPELNATRDSIARLEQSLKKVGEQLTENQASQ